MPWSVATSTRAIGIGLWILQSALLVPIALLVRNAFDEQIPNGRTDALIATGAVVLLLYLGSSALGLLTRFITLKVTKRSITELRGALIDKVHSLPLSYFDEADVGTLHSTIVQDTERVDAMVNAVIARAPPAVIVGTGLGLRWRRWTCCCSWCWRP